MAQEWELFGFSPVPRDPEVLFKDHPTASGPNPKQDLFVADDLPLPDTPLVREVRAFAQVRYSPFPRRRWAQWLISLLLSQKELDEQTFNHSNRVFVYGSAIAKTHFPAWKYSETPTIVETYALSCLMHDIGTAEKFLATTHMSFEFKGAIVARELILQLGAPEAEADGVCDAIIRHQDIFVKG